VTARAIRRSLHVRKLWWHPTGDRYRGTSRGRASEVARRFPRRASAPSAPDRRTRGDQRARV